MGLERQWRQLTKGSFLTGGTDGFETTNYATSVPGLYAVGDIWEKALWVIADVHRYLADRRAPAANPDSTLAALQSVNERNQQY